MKNLIFWLIVAIVVSFLLDSIFTGLIETHETAKPHLIGHDCGFFDERVIVVHHNRVMDSASILRASGATIDIDSRMLFNCIKPEKKNE